jgi:hypothetical protein
MDVFNDREKATACWLLIAIAFAAFKPAGRSFLLSCIRIPFEQAAFRDVKIALMFLFMLAYTAIAVYILSLIGLWNPYLLKDTIVWFCLIPIVASIRCFTATEPQKVLRKTMIDSFKMGVILEFMVNTYTFPLVGELIFVPMIFFLAVIEVVAKPDPNSAIVARGVGMLLAIVGTLLLLHFAYQLFVDFHEVVRLGTLRSILLLPVLTLLFAPVIYILVLCVIYEELFLRLKRGTQSSDSLKRYARCRIVMNVRFSLKRILEIRGNHAGSLMSLRTKADVDTILLPRNNT